MRCACCVRDPTTRDWERIVRVARDLRWTADTFVTISAAHIAFGEQVRSVRAGWMSIELDIMFHVVLAAADCSL